MQVFRAHSFWMLLPAIIILSIAACPTGAGPVEFDASACEVDSDGKVIVRLISGIAFALPPSGLFIDHPQSDDPNASVPLGCPGNPIRSADFIIGPGAFLRTSFPRPVSISRLGAVGHNGPARNHGWLVSFLGEHRDLERRCGVTAEGIDFCYGCREDVSRPGYCGKKEGVGVSSDGRPLSRASIFLVDSQNLTGPSSTPWAARCSAAITEASRFCSTGYELRDGLSIAYRFGQGELDLNNLRAIDLSVREEILSYLAPEYDGIDMR